MSTVLDSPPYTPVEPVTEIFHGVKVTDPYRWLEDQDSERTRRWIEGQINYSRAFLDSIPERERVRRRVAELLSVETIDTPHKIGNRYFFLRRGAQQDQPIICMQEDQDGDEQVLVDPAVRVDNSKTSVRIISISPDGKLLAYGVRHGGEDYQAVEIIDVDSLKVLSDGLPCGFLGSFTFAADSKSYYYVHQLIGPPDSNRCAAYQHIIGRDPTEDQEIFFAGEYPQVRLGMQFSDDRHYVGYLVFRCGTKNTIELHVQEIFGNSPTRLIAGEMDEPFYPHFIGKQFIGKQLIVLTSWQAPNRKIIAIDLDAPDRANWRDVIPESTSSIRDFTVRADKIFVSYVENISTRTDIYALSGRMIGSIPYPARGSARLFPHKVESDELFYSFSSFAHPDSIFSYRIKTGEQRVRSQKKVAFNPASIEVAQVWYESKDGTRVPMFLIGKKGLQKTNNIPTILTGYGGFGKSLTPQFSAFATFLVERGCLFAAANIRGGSEFGEQWYLDGKRHKRQNAFDDFIAAAEWLIQTGYTSPEKLAIAGGSNGGLLVGAALTQRPDLFRAVVGLGPLLDMLGYRRFPMTELLVDEFGSPDDPEDFRHLYAYSPYHRVQVGIEYPAILLISGDADTRCNPMHARKMIAKLQAATASDKPILLEYRALRGHMPMLPLADRIEALTDRLAFICDQLDVLV